MKYVQQKKEITNGVQDSLKKDVTVVGNMVQDSVNGGVKTIVPINK